MQRYYENRITDSLCPNSELAIFAIDSQTNLNLFSRPYPYSSQKGHRLWQAIIFGIFVFAFLVLFKPFGLSASSLNIYIIGASFGFVTIVCMLIMNVLIPSIIPKFFNNEKWTTGKETLWTALNVLVIGLGNCLLYTILWPSSFSWSLVFSIELFTISIGIIPIAFFVNLREKKLFKLSQKESELTNSIIENNANISEEIIHFPSNNKNEEFNLKLSQLLYIEAADNYAEVYYLSENESDNTLLQKILRIQLNQLEIHFQNQPSILRCHKSFLVNLNNVVHVFGNAQGYKLQLKHCDFEVPVSRSKSTDTLTQLKAR